MDSKLSKEIDRQEEGMKQQWLMKIAESERRPNPVRSDRVKKKNCEVRLLTSTTYRDYKEPVDDLSFNGDDLRGIVTPHKDALTIHMDIGGVMVTKIMVDGGSSANVIFKTSYDQIKNIPRYEPSIGCWLDMREK